MVRTWKSKVVTCLDAAHGPGPKKRVPRVAQPQVDAMHAAKGSPWTGRRGGAMKQPHGMFFLVGKLEKLHQIQIDMLKGNKKKACNQRSHWVGST